MTKRFQFRHVNELTGVFVLAILLGAVLALFVAGRSQNWFAAKIEYQLQLPPTGAFGLKPGNDVVVLGMPAGVVKDLEVDPDGRLDARIRLRRDFAPFIRADTQATIKKVFGVAGDSFVELSRGTTGEALEHGATISCRSSEELPSVMERWLGEVRAEVIPIARKTAALIDEWSRLGTNLNTSNLELHQALARFNGIAANLEAGRGSAGRLLTDTNLIAQGERLLGRSREALADLHVVIVRLKEGTERLPEVVESLRRSTVRLPDISRAVEAETRDLPGLVLQVQQAVAELRRLTEAMQRHWILRKYVEPPSSGGRIPTNHVLGGTP